MERRSIIHQLLKSKLKQMHQAGEFSPQSGLWKQKKANSLQLKMSFMHFWIQTLI